MTSRRRELSTLYGEPCKAQLQRAVDHLNLPEVPDPGHRELMNLRVRTELRRLVREWQESGPNLEKMFRREPSLQGRAQAWKTLFVASDGPRGFILPATRSPEPGPSHLEDLAFSYFLQIVVSPFWDMLGGPCDGCGNFYIKKTVRQKRFCTRACGAEATAKAALQKRRKAETAAKIKSVQKTIDIWVKTRSNPDCKKWVSRKAAVSLSWLTRHTNLTHLKFPPAERAESGSR